MSLETRFDGLYKFFLNKTPHDWKWVKAVAMHESNENPWAIGDGGKAVGLLQQHQDWQDTYHPQDSRPSNLVAWFETDKRWHPAYQIACFATLWYHPLHAKLDERTKVLTYHWGHISTADTDGYYADVMRQFQLIPE